MIFSIMNLQQILENKTKEGFLSLYNTSLPSVEFQTTRKEFEGDITLVTFPMLRYHKTNPEKLGNDLGEYLATHLEEVEGYNVVKGFLNLVISDTYYLNFFRSIKDNALYGFQVPAQDEKAVMVEYASPNTNKPLHLGHIRNVLLGYSVAEILKASGK